MRTPLNSQKERPASAIVCVMFLSFFVLLASCNGGKKQPEVKEASMGKPFRVVLLAEDSVMETLLDSMLSTPVEALPQEEPSFDVMKVKTDDGGKQLGKSRVVVKTAIDPSRFKTVGVTYVNDRYAFPQLIVSVNAPSVESVFKAKNELALRIKKVLEDFEKQDYERILVRKGNSAMEKKARDMFKVKMKVPQDLTVSLMGKDFLWMSSNTDRAMRNICIYTVPARHLTPDMLLALRDSVEGKNIKGQTARQHMVTDVKNAVFSRAIIHGDTVLQVRTLWNMENDIMAGPLYLTARYDRKNCRVVVAEAFLYAPEQKKRNIMHQLETAINTLKIN